MKDQSMVTQPQVQSWKQNSELDLHKEYLDYVQESTLKLNELADTFQTMQGNIDRLSAAFWKAKREKTGLNFKNSIKGIIEKEDQYSSVGEVIADLKNLLKSTENGLRRAKYGINLLSEEKIVNPLVIPSSLELDPRGDKDVYETRLRPIQEENLMVKLGGPQGIKHRAEDVATHTSQREGHLEDELMSSDPSSSSRESKNMSKLTFNVNFIQNDRRSHKIGNHPSAKQLIRARLKDTSTNPDTDSQQAKVKDGTNPKELADSKKKQLPLTKMKFKITHQEFSSSTKPKKTGQAFQSLSIGVTPGSPLETATEASRLAETASKPVRPQQLGGPVQTQTVIVVKSKAVDGRDPETPEHARKALGNLKGASQMDHDDWSATDLKPVSFASIIKKRIAKTLGIGGDERRSISSQPKGSREQSTPPRKVILKTSLRED